MNQIRLRSMRYEVLRALASLSDAAYQERAWLRQEFDTGTELDDFSQVVHVLFDDASVLPNPASAIGDVLFSGEVAAFEELGRVLKPILDSLGDAPDRVYLEHSDWQLVVLAGSAALAAMVRHGTLVP